MVTGARYSPVITQQTHGSEAGQGLSQKVSPRVRVQGTRTLPGAGMAAMGQGLSPHQASLQRSLGPHRPRAPKDRGHPQLALSLASQASLRGRGMLSGPTSVDARMAKHDSQAWQRRWHRHFQLCLTSTQKAMSLCLGARQLLLAALV